MGGTQDLAALIERLEAATAEARDVLREVHAATKDGRAVLKEFRALLDTNVTVQVNAALIPVVEKIGNELVAHVQELKDEIDSTVHERVDRELAQILGNRRNPSAPTMAELLSAAEVVHRMERHGIEKEK